MKWTLVIIFSILLTGFTNHCDKLPDGTYSVKHTLSGMKEYKITINKSSYSIVTDTSAADVGDVLWLGDCVVKFKPHHTVKVDTTELGKKLYHSFGEPCLEFKQVRGDTIYFKKRWSGNLHITIDEGYFLRVK